MTNHADRITPQRSARTGRTLTEQLTTLVEVQTREYIMGLAATTADERGYAAPREAEETRELLDEAIAARHRRGPDGYAQAVLRGREVLAERSPKA